VNEEICDDFHPDLMASSHFQNDCRRRRRRRTSAQNVPPNGRFLGPFKVGNLQSLNFAVCCFVDPSIILIG
jgi:hypothetical protein